MLSRISNTACVPRKIHTSSVSQFGGPEVVMATSVGISIAGFVASRIRVAESDQYLIKTGPMVVDETGLDISKWTIRWPFQKISVFELQPSNYSFEFNAMSSEMLTFKFPGSFTIGPDDNKDALVKYAKFMITSSHPNETYEEMHKRFDQHVRVLIQGVIEGDTRSLAAQMTMQEIFDGREQFREKVIEHIGNQLDQFGLKIYNANIKDLEDGEGCTFFAEKRKKKMAEVSSQARIDVSEAEKRGNIGEKERQVETRKRLAELECDAVETENANQQQVAKYNADLVVVQAESLRQEETARVESEMRVKMRQAEMQKDVEERRAEQETAQLRADEMSKANIYYETETRRAEADAQRVTISAEAALLAASKEADGIQAILTGKANGYREVSSSTGLGSEDFLNYLMIENGVLQKLAAERANALQNLKPEIKNFNITKGNTEADNSITNIMEMIPPIASVFGDYMKPKHPEE